MKRILVVDGDTGVRARIAKHARMEGYDVTEAGDGETALSLSRQQNAFDLMVLAVNLPGMDGFTVLKAVRTFSAIPVLILSSKNTAEDRIHGLELWADDYMTKPFSVLELLARVRSLLRRTKEEEPEQPKLFDCGALHLDLETREVKVNGSEVLLTYKEYELLVYLAENQNRVVSRDELLDKLWDWRADVETRTLDIHIKTLRQKLGEEAGHYIKTVRSVGYRFMKPQE